MGNAVVAGLGTALSVTDNLSWLTAEPTPLDVNAWPADEAGEDEGGVFDTALDRFTPVDVPAAVETPLAEQDLPDQLALSRPGAMAGDLHAGLALPEGELPHPPVLEAGFLSGTTCAILAGLGLVGAAGALVQRQRRWTGDIRPRVLAVLAKANNGDMDALQELHSFLRPNSCDEPILETPDFIARQNGRVARLIAGSLDPVQLFTGNTPRAPLQHPERSGRPSPDWHCFTKLALDIVSLRPQYATRLFEDLQVVLNRLPYLHPVIKTAIFHTLLDAARCAKDQRLANEAVALALAALDNDLADIKRNFYSNAAVIIGYLARYHDLVILLTYETHDIEFDAHTLQAIAELRRFDSRCCREEIRTLAGDTRRVMMQRREAYAAQSGWFAPAADQPRLNRLSVEDLEAMVEEHPERFALFDLNRRILDRADLPWPRIEGSGPNPEFTPLALLLIRFALRVPMNDSARTHYRHEEQANRALRRVLDLISPDLLGSTQHAEVTPIVAALIAAARLRPYLFTHYRCDMERQLATLAAQTGLSAEYAALIREHPELAPAEQATGTG